jgi:hypothetical protein
VLGVPVVVGWLWDSVLTVGAAAGGGGGGAGGSGNAGGGDIFESRLFVGRRLGSLREAFRLRFGELLAEPEGLPVAMGDSSRMMLFFLLGEIFKFEGSAPDFCNATGALDRRQLVL